MTPISLRSSPQMAVDTLPSEDPPSSSTTDTSPSTSTDSSSEIPAVANAPPAIDEGFVDISLEDFVNTGKRSVRSTPDGPFNPNTTPFRYYDMCSELDEFLNTLPTFSYPACDKALQLLEKDTANNVGTIQVPDDAALGQDVLYLSNEPQSPLSSPLLEALFTARGGTSVSSEVVDVGPPVGKLRIDKDSVTHMIAISPETSADDANRGSEAKADEKSPSPATKVLQDMMGKKTKVY